jgi:hypothetical protein
MIKPSTGLHDLLSTRTMVRPSAQHFYAASLKLLGMARVPLLVGGAFALKHYAGIARDTKDLDVFLRRSDLDRALQVLDASGYTTELCFPHWLAKAYSNPAHSPERHFVDFIFNSANGLCPVDDEWFENAPKCTLWGAKVLLCPIEEMIWTKSFVMERERFDGADIYHLLEARGETIDWPRLLARFGENWRVLYGHLVFYSYVYPNRRSAVPESVMRALAARAQREALSEPVKVCRGTLVSREQYLVDIDERGYEDARLAPWGPISEDDVALWTDAIGQEK